VTDLAWATGMFLLGGALAGLWLAALWRSVRGLAGAGRPYLRLAGGAVLRLAVVAAGLYLVVAGGRHWTHVLAALAGFVAVRSLVLLAVRRRAAAARTDSRDAA